MAVYTQIDNPELYFQCKIYTGNFSTQSITLDGSEDMSPNLVWIKEISVSGNHQLQDSVRGTSKKLMPNSAGAESTGETAYITSFDSDGFSIGANNGINQSGVTNVAWCWKEASGIFDIVSYTGNETPRTQAHSLSAVPHVMIVKNRETGDDWNVYHHKNTSAPETDYLVLQTNAATNDYPQWNDTVPTSSVFSLGASTGVNDDTGMIAYLWSEKQGYMKAGSYTGNGSASNGAFIYTGFRPALVIAKRTNGTANWVLFDNKRSGFNVDNDEASPNTTNGGNDGQTYKYIDLLSNGFKWRENSNNKNSSGDTFIYMAFAEAPFVNSKGVPCNAR